MQLINDFMTGGINVLVQLLISFTLPVVLHLSNKFLAEYCLSFVYSGTVNLGDWLTMGCSYNQNGIN